MTHRPGITLLEVLVAMFIMGIGLLSLLVLFPLAALTMQQAIRDDRSAQAAQQANGWALALLLRTDPAVQPALLPPNLPCYVDGIALGGGYPLGTTLVSTTTPTISRIYPSFPGWGGAPPSNVNALKHFSTLDDITFYNNGMANDPTGTVTFVERAGRYTWAYFLSNAGVNSTSGLPLVDLQVVVYSARTIQSAETVLTPTGSPSASANGTGASTVLISYPGTPPPIRRGSWIFDGGPASAAPTGFFYRVVDVIDLGGSLQLDLETPLLSNVNTTNALLYLEDVIDVFDQGAQ
jgi:prepilin-type N-terminal cleavage/methylation domain-containing protein